MPDQLTLREMVGSGEKVRLYCLECHRDRTVALSSLVSERDIEANVSTAELGRRIRCRRCDRKRVQIMAPSHDIGIRKDDKLTRLLESNVKKVPCPECGSQIVSRSCPERRPYTKGPRFKPYTLMHQYTCEECLNWWTAE